jgi:hypothetical protein
MNRTAVITSRKILFMYFNGYKGLTKIVISMAISIAINNNNNNNNNNKSTPE